MSTGRRAGLRTRTRGYGCIKAAIRNHPHKKGSERVSRHVASAREFPSLPDER